jgi:hypothetical protein
VLVFVLAVPFFVLGALFGDAWAKLIPINLPLSAFIFVTPLTAAAILTAHEQGAAGVKALLKRAFDAGRIRDRRWLLVAVGLWPAIMVVEYGIMRWIGVPLPGYKLDAWLVPVLAAVFFTAGIFEEVGWTGFATDRLQERYSALQTALIIGVVWGLLHVTADLQGGQALDWIAWQRVGNLSRRVLTVWLYNNAGRSVFAVVLFHAVENLAVFTFPNYGSHYDPFLTLVITAVLAAIVVVLWGPQTLARYRYRRLRGTVGQA